MPHILLKAVRIAAATTLAFLVYGISFSQTLYVPSGTGGIGSSSNGNVGIGISSPGSKLSVAGDLLIQNANLPSGLITEVGGYTPLFNLSVNFREPNKDNTYRGAGFRIDTRNSTPLFQWITRSAGTSTEYLRMVLTEDGKLGVGTTSPSSQLHVVGSGGAQLDFQVNGRIKTGDSNHLGGIVVNTEESMFMGQSSSTSMGLYNGGWRLTVDNSGKVGIGTTTPDQMLTVNGTVHSTRVKVEATVPGPDYVFDKEYDLRSLDDLKTYIDENQHLPEVPSAKEMEKNGIDVGEMNLLLLKKVEELTLHLIEQQKRIKSLEEKIKN